MSETPTLILVKLEIDAVVSLHGEPTKEHVEFILNEGTSCMNNYMVPLSENIIKMQRIQDDEIEKHGTSSSPCTCRAITSRFVRVATPDDIESSLHAYDESEQA